MKWYWKAKKPYGSTERCIVILHEPSFATMNGLHSNYYCVYIGHNVAYSNNYTWCEDDKKSPISTGLCVLIQAWLQMLPERFLSSDFLKPTM